MSDLVVITWTTGNIDEARRVSRYLVQERLVACAQINPWMESVYMWDNELQTEQETKVMFKTEADRFDEIVSTIKANTTYEVPEILMHKIDQGNQDYLSWVKESLGEKAEAK